MKKNLLGFHPFHILDMSPWPLLCSLAAFNLLVNFFFYLSRKEFFWFIVSILSLVALVYQWWRDIVRESTFQGCHTSEVQKGMAMGMVLFIISEVMFFFSFFFGFFFTVLSPDIHIGMCWPPKGIQPLSFMMVPLLNTIILLASGVSITWSHHSLLEGKYSDSIWGLVISILCGVVFMFFQWEEYYYSSFTFADSIYGSLFFLMTGFHGFHVMVGICFLLASLLRMSMNQFSSTHHFGFEASSWYWHFVDVVWLFLFVSVYWWGS